MENLEKAAWTNIFNKTFKFLVLTFIWVVCDQSAQNVVHQPLFIYPDIRPLNFGSSDGKRITIEGRVLELSLSLSLGK